MAHESWIESATRIPKPPKGGFIDRRARHILAGASESARHDPDTEERAARLLARTAPDCAEPLGLDALPGPDAAAPLIALVAAGDRAAARGWIGDRTRAEISAVRAALAERRAGREAG